jgi:DNA-binding transcriptional regulator YdaS (Cro superfamily)
MDAIKRAIAAAGGQTALAGHLGITQCVISQWVNGGRPVPLDRCPKIYEVTGVPVEELRPDVRWLKYAGKYWVDVTDLLPRFSRKPKAVA